MPTTLTLKAPSDYDLARDFCSYGYFLLEPNHWEPETQSAGRVLQLDEGPAAALIDQRASGDLRARFDRTLGRSEQGEARRQLARMLGVDVSESEIRDFHRVDPRWKKTGRGRLCRSPTLFEDIIKTVTSCNVAWPSTITMNRRLCEVSGAKSPSGAFAFPTPQKLARTKPLTLRSRCRVGYRDTRIVELSRLFVKGHIDETWLGDPRTQSEEVFAFLKSLPGIGPYAAGNIMQLLGRYDRLAIDTESFRHARVVLGMDGSDRQLNKQLVAYYDAFGKHRFRSYWFELWDFYESKKGPAKTWEKHTTGTTFTASHLNG